MMCENVRVGSRKHLLAVKHAITELSDTLELQKQVEPPSER